MKGVVAFVFWSIIFVVWCLGLEVLMGLLWRWTQ